MSDTALGLLSLLHRETKRLINDPTAIVGASGLKAMTTALSTVRSDLQACGVIRTADEIMKPMTLTVRVLTPEEEADIRRAAEAESPEDDAPSVPIERYDRGVSVPESRTPPADDLPTTCPPFIPGPLPPREGFADWLRMVGRQCGLVVLRRIVRELTGDASDMMGVTMEALCTRIIELTDGNPDRLRSWSTS